MAAIECGMSRWVGRVALVTGASSGIGQAIAKALANHGMKVIGCARNIQVIEEDSASLRNNSAIGTLEGIKCDLSKENEILDMFAQIKEKYGGVDVCINNAGLLHANSVGEGCLGLLNGETDKWRDMLNVNVLAVAICSREAVKQMEAKGDTCGQLIMMNSLSGHRVVNRPDNHFYSSNKFAVTSLVEGLRQELVERKSNIRVAQISPGLVETNFRERSYPNDSPEKCNKMYTVLKTLQSDDIADAVVYILQTPQHCQVHDILMRPTEQRT